MPKKEKEEKRNEKRNQKDADAHARACDRIRNCDLSRRSDLLDRKKAGTEFPIKKDTGKSKPVSFFQFHEIFWRVLHFHVHRNALFEHRK